jgi:hypothetical protein
MPYIFLLHSFLEGGTETEVINLANELARDEIVFIKVFTNNISSENLQQLDSRIILYKPKLKFKNNLRYLNYFFISNEFSKYDIVSIHATDFLTYMYATILLFFNKKNKLTLGVYHQREFILPEILLSSRILKKLISILSPKQILTANKTVSENLKFYFSLPFEPTLKNLSLKLDGCSITDSERDIDILIVARLFTYKKYIQDVLNILSTSSQYKIVVIGDGPELENLKEKFKIVEFCGRKSSFDLKEYYNRAKLLVGNGTVCIEAYKYNCPTIVVCDEGLEYGFFGWLHEVNLDYSYTRYSEKLTFKYTRFDLLNFLETYLQNWNYQILLTKVELGKNTINNKYSNSNTLSIFKESHINVKYPLLTIVWYYFVMFEMLLYFIINPKIYKNRLT